MNQTASPGNSFSIGSDTTSALTTVHLAWLVVLAVLVVIGILYGVRLKWRRDAAQRAVVEHAAEAGIAPAPVADDGDEATPIVPSAPLPAPSSAARPSAPSPSAPSPVDAAIGDADGPVTQLKGLGPKVAARLADLGIATVGQVAALDHDAAQRLDAQLGPFSGRMERDRWIEQARFLAAGDRAGFEAVFGKL